MFRAVPETNFSSQRIKPLEILTKRVQQPEERVFCNGIINTIGVSINILAEER